MKKVILLMILALSTACSPPVTLQSTPEAIRIFASDITQPWLQTSYDCARTLQIVLYRADSPAEAQINIRLGEPQSLNSLAFQIGQDDLLVVTNPQNPAKNLSPAQVRKIFSQTSDEETLVWVFAPESDVQEIFSREVLQDSRVTSLARLALSPEQMQAAIGKDQNSVGILTRHWLTNSQQVVFSIDNIPVLALTPSEPVGAIKNLIACLQKK